MMQRGRKRLVGIFCKRRWRYLSLLIPCIHMLVCCGLCEADIYKYKRDGVWYYTDTPPKELPPDSETMIEIARQVPAQGSDGEPLLADFPAGNAIEQAATATVAVKSNLGYGSGFFISSQGHIITNKHVVRATAAQSQKNENYFNTIENRISELDKKFADERNRLAQYRDRIDRLKRAAEVEPDPIRRESYREDYKANSQRYETWRSDLGKREKKYEDEKKKFRDGRQNFIYSKSLANLSQRFTIVLADQTERYARLLKISKAHDLALLKLDGYSTPALTPASTHQLRQTDPVYAIGNPAKQHNSVTSGVFSGFEKGFLQTNAQIYPGNSGGPLVTEDGRVVGINTFKKLTHKFEGLGFAIPIEVALKEFSEHLPLK